MKDAVNIAETSIEDYEETMRSNCTGIWACMKYELDAIQKFNEGGAIVNCTSYGGKFGVPAFEKTGFLCQTRFNLLSTDGERGRKIRGESSLSGNLLNI